MNVRGMNLLNQIYDGSLVLYRTYFPLQQSETAAGDIYKQMLVSFSKEMIITESYCMKVQAMKESNIWCSK